MRHIFLIFPIALLFAALPEQGFAQTLPETEDTDDMPIFPLSDQNVQPIPRPSRTETITPVPAEPLYLNSGQNPPPNVTRPLEPLTQPSIDRLYKNRMEVDNYVPETPQNPVLGPPPGNMQPEQAPNRPGTIGSTHSQGKLD